LQGRDSRRPFHATRAPAVRVPADSPTAVTRPGPRKHESTKAHEEEISHDDRRHSSGRERRHAAIASTFFGHRDAEAQRSERTLPDGNASHVGRRSRPARWRAKNDRNTSARDLLACVPAVLRAPRRRKRRRATRCSSVSLCLGGKSSSCLFVFFVSSWLHLFFDGRSTQSGHTTLFLFTLAITGWYLRLAQTSQQERGTHATYPFGGLAGGR